MNTNELRDEYFMKAAIEQAKDSLGEFGIPIGAVLVMDDKIIGRGHNRRVQFKSPILHAEIDCLADAGRLTAKEYRKCTIYSTLSPCTMCSGAIALYSIPTVVIGENDTYMGCEWLMKDFGSIVTNLDLQVCKDMMKTFIEENPTLWNEDVGE